MMDLRDSVVDKTKNQSKQKTTIKQKNPKQTKQNKTSQTLNNIMKETDSLCLQKWEGDF